MTVLKWIGAAAVLMAAGGLTLAYAEFGAFTPWRETAEVDRLADLAGVRPGQTVAEIGAGSGRFAVAMARRVGPAGRVFATELSPDRRRDIRERVKRTGVANVTVVEAADDATNLPDDCCDVLFMRNVYHHIQAPEGFLASVMMAVKPGGVAVIIDFEPGALWLHGGRAGAGARRPGHGVGRADAVAEMQAAGFHVRHEDARWGGPMWVAVFDRR